MKKTILMATSAAAIALAMPTSAQAADLDSTMNWYVSGFGGASFYHEPKLRTTFVPTTYKFSGNNVGFTAGGAIGVKGIFMPNLRHELEVSYSQLKTKNIKLGGVFVAPFKFKFSTINVLANTWYDFDNETAFTPYVGAGAGIGIVTEKPTNVGPVPKKTSVGFAFQVGAGVKYAIAEAIDLDVGYRLRGVVGVKHIRALGPSKKFNLFSHNVQAGVSFRF